MKHSQRETLRSHVWYRVKRLVSYHTLNRGPTKSVETEFLIRPTVTSELPDPGARIT